MLVKIIGIMHTNQRKYFSPEELAKELNIGPDTIKKILIAGVKHNPSLFFCSGTAGWQITGEAESLYNVFYIRSEHQEKNVLKQYEEEMISSLDKFELDNNGLKMFKPHTVFIVDMLYEHPLMESEAVLQYEYEYKIYLIKLGTGNRPIFLITEPYVNLPLGTSELLIRHVKEPFEELNIHEPDTNIMKKICSLCGLKENKNEDIKIEDVWQELLEMNKSKIVFATFAQPITKDILDVELRTWTEKDFQSMIDKFYEVDGWKVDDELKYVYRADKVKITKGKLSPYEIMKYQPHKIIVAPTKVGKTSIAKINGIVLDRVSGSRFLGFSTAKDINPGLGNGLLEPTYFDEVSSLTQIIIDHILNYLEFGEARIEVGKMGIITKGWSCCAFHSNPEVPTDDPTHLLIGLNAFLQKFSNRMDAVGSRIALIIFNTDWKKAKKIKKITSEERIKNKILFETILDMIQPSIENLFFKEEIIEWIETPITVYTQKIRSLLEKNITTIPDIIRQLYISHCDGCFRHLRGFAFKQAVLDNLKEIYFNELNIERFLDCCNEHLQKAQNINLKSLQNMCQTGFDKNDIIIMNFAELPDYLKAFIIAFGEWIQENKDKDIALIEELGQKWDKYVEGMTLQPNSDNFGGYSYFSRVLDRLKRVNLSSINKKLEPFGIEICELNNQKIARISKKEAQIFSISQFLDFLKGCVYIEKGNMGFVKDSEIIEKYENMRKKVDIPIYEKKNNTLYPPPEKSFFLRNREKNITPPITFQPNSERVLGIFNETADSEGNCFVEDFKAALEDTGFSDSEKIVEDMLRRGVLFEPRAGFLRAL